MEPFIDNKGWRYLAIENNGSLEFKVEPTEEDKKKRPVPETLFKYHALTEYAIEALENKYIYAPDRWELNDPFDCHINLIDYSKVDNVFIEAILSNSFGTDFILEQLVRDNGYTALDADKSWRNRIIDMLPALGFSNLQPKDKEWLIRTYKNRFWLVYYHYFFTKYGIISLTTKPDHILMWAHYGKNEGFVIEYSSNELRKLFQGPFPINYQSETKRCCFKLYRTAADLYMTNVKSLKWEYEDEWRFLATKEHGMNLPGIDKGMNQLSDRKFAYEGSVLSVTLGGSFFKKDQLNVSSDGTKFIVKVEGLKLRVINHCLSNQIPVYLIIPPDLETNIRSEEALSFQLSRQKIEINRVLANEFELNIL